MNDNTSRSKNATLKRYDSDDDNENDGLNYGPEKDDDDDDWDNQYHFIKLFRVTIKYWILKINNNFYLNKLNLTDNFNLLINFKNVLAPYIECYGYILKFFDTLTAEIEYKGFIF